MVVMQRGITTTGVMLTLLWFQMPLRGERFRDRNKIRRIKLEISCDLEPLPFRPEDFTTDDPFVQKIIETGMRVV